MTMNGLISGRQIKFPLFNFASVIVLAAHMAKKLIHKSLFGVFLFFSYLPSWFLYILADINAFLLYYVIRYRRKVVSQNLEIAFPEMDKKERKKIGKKFYRDFCEHFSETIKLLTISKKQLQSMFDADYSVIEKLNSEGKCCYILLGHQFNWELANAHMSSLYDTRNIVAYLPVLNEFFDQLLIRIRTRFGAVLTPSDKLLRGIFPYRNETYNVVLMADQNPSDMSRAYWIKFFDRQVPFFKGPEKGARAGNNPVTFVTIEKVKRGRYRIKTFLLAEEPKHALESSITFQYSSKLEDSIRNSPSNYLWSHRRWRFAREDFNTVEMKSHYSEG